MGAGLYFGNGAYIKATYPSPTIVHSGAGSSLSLDPPQGVPGLPVTVRGSGFRPGENITVTFDTCHDEAVATASSTGTFVLSEHMTTNLDWCVVSAMGDSSRRSAQETFTLLGNGGLPGEGSQGSAGTSLSLDPPQGVSGSPVTVRGSGFRPGENITVTFDTCHDEAVATASSTGTFVLSEHMTTNLFWCSVAAEGGFSHRWRQALFTLKGN